MRRTITGDSRGVTALLGYLLLFAVVLSGALVLTTVGMSVVVDSGSEHHRSVGIENVARLDGAVREITDGAPYRETRLDPMDATVTYGERYTVTVTASGGSVDLDGTNAVQATGRTIQYDLTDGGTITYASGLTAYHEASSERAVLEAPPAFRSSGSRLVVALPETARAARSSQLVGAQSGGTVPVVLDRGDSKLVKRVGTTVDGDLTAMDGTIRIEGSGVAGAWATYLEDREAFEPTDLDGDGTDEYVADTDGDGETDTAGAAFETQRLYVRAVPISVSLGETL